METEKFHFCSTTEDIVSILWSYHGMGKTHFWRWRRNTLFGLDRLCRTSRLASLLFSSTSAWRSGLGFYWICSHALFWPSSDRTHRLSQSQSHSHREPRISRPLRPSRCVIDRICCTSSNVACSQRWIVDSGPWSAPPPSFLPPSGMFDATLFFTYFILRFSFIIYVNILTMLFRLHSCCCYLRNVKKT